MPLYEFQCDDCHAEVELLIRGDDQPECPECHSRRMQKLLSAPAAHVASGLPMSAPRSLPGVPGGGGCGKPQCGQGRCMGGM